MSSSTVSYNNIITMEVMMKSMPRARLNHRILLRYLRFSLVPLCKSVVMMASGKAVARANTHGRMNPVCDAADMGTSTPKNATAASGQNATAMSMPDRNAPQRPEIIFRCDTS